MNSNNKNPRINFVLVALIFLVLVAVAAYLLFFLPAAPESSQTPSPTPLPSASSFLLTVADLPGYELFSVEDADLRILPAESRPLVSEALTARFRANTTEVIHTVIVYSREPSTMLQLPQNVFSPISHADLALVMLGEKPFTDYCSMAFSPDRNYYVNFASFQSGAIESVVVVVSEEPSITAADLLVAAKAKV